MKRYPWVWCSKCRVYARSEGKERQAFDKFHDSCTVLEFWGDGPGEWEKNWAVQRIEKPYTNTTRQFSPTELLAMQSKGIEE